MADRGRFTRFLIGLWVVGLLGMALLLAEKFLALPKLVSDFALVAGTLGILTAAFVLTLGYVLFRWHDEDLRRQGYRPREIPRDERRPTRRRGRFMSLGVIAFSIAVALVFILVLLHQQNCVRADGSIRYREDVPSWRGTVCVPRAFANTERRGEAIEIFRRMFPAVAGAASQR